MPRHGFSIMGNEHSTVCCSSCQYLLIRWLIAPEPDEENEYLPGLARRNAISSFTLFDGIDGLTTRTNGLVAMRLIGAKSFSGSYPTFRTWGLTEIGPIEPTRIVYPSAVDLAATSEPITPPAPGRLS